MFLPVWIQLVRPSTIPDMNSGLINLFHPIGTLSIMFHWIISLVFEFQCVSKQLRYCQLSFTDISYSVVVIEIVGVKLLLFYPKVVSKDWWVKFLLTAHQQRIFFVGTDQYYFVSGYEYIHYHKYFDLHMFIELNVAQQTNNHFIYNWILTFDKKDLNYLPLNYVCRNVRWIDEW